MDCGTLKKMNTGTWTECEHKNFLLGLSIYGRGKWKKIALKFVKTRNATQVASHAQKYMKKRRFDLDTQDQTGTVI